jgi:hypothetical protein
MPNYEARNPLSWNPSEGGRLVSVWEVSDMFQPSSQGVLGDLPGNSKREGRVRHELNGRPLILTHNSNV